MYRGEIALWVQKSADDFIFFYLFFQEIGFDISCKSSSLETISMKCQNLFSGENHQFVVC